MFFDLDLTGEALPPKTLCLTYDDGPGQTDDSGPGPKTAELGRYLAERGIAATFFVIGQHVRAYPGIVARLRAGGHIVANHTDTHPTLVSFTRDGGDVAGELARTDEAIGSPSASGELTFFRAPYGNWREDPTPIDPVVAPDLSHDPDATTSATARVLNQGGRFPHMVGPVGWDIDRFDWNCWRSGVSAEECGQQYLTAIEAAGRGIVLMHDSSETEAMRNGNLAFELTRWLVPRLEDLGYRFVRLDQVPGVASAARVTRQVQFERESGQWLTCPGDSTRIQLTTSHRIPGGRERFGIVPVGQAERGELVGLRAWNGRYLARVKGGEIRADATTIDDAARWQLAPTATGRFEIRSSQHESVTEADHPGEVRLHATSAQPIAFTVRSVVEVDPL